MSRGVKIAFGLVAAVIVVPMVVQDLSQAGPATAQPDAPPATTSVPPEPAAPKAPATFAQKNPLAACQAAVAVMNSQSPRIIRGHITPDGLAHVEYRRPDDGKRWQWRCRIEPDGKHLTWAAFDAFGDGTQGRWRTEDEIIVDVDDRNPKKIEAWLNQAGEARSDSFDRTDLDLAKD